MRVFVPTELQRPLPADRLQIVAEGAYNAAVQMRRPDANLTLRHGARVVRKARQ